MKKILVAILAVVGGLAILGCVIMLFFSLASVAGKPGVARVTILQVDFEQGVIEAIPDDPLAELMLKDALQVVDVVDALERAAEDDRVAALVARIGGGGMGLAHIQEIRDAVLRFRESGKPTIAYAETFGEFGPGNGGYYLATAFDEIQLQPSGDVGITGLMYETPFLRGTLEKLGIEPQMDHRYEFKNAKNVYTERSYTEAHRTAMQELMDSQFGQIVRGVAEARGMAEDEVRAMFDAGPYLGPEALERGLVDGLRYEDEIYADLREQFGDRLRPLYLGAYLERVGRPHRRGETVALVHAYGAVTRGKSGYAPLDGSVIMGSDSVAAALRTAIDDDRVKAIVLRVESPGGSYVGSDTIWRETKRVRESGKPLIVSMGNLAGSGGYFIAMDADRIVAQPGTITASIGVLGGKFHTTGLWDKVGISFDEVHTSRNGTIFSGIHPYDEGTYERFQAWLDRVYEDFTNKVAEGRDLPLEQVLEIARGRIWTGEDAREIGLVDELGGLHEAFALAREELGLAEDAPIRVRRIPPPRSPWEVLFGEKEDHREAAVAALTRSLETLQPQLRVLTRAVEVGEPGLRVPEVGATP